MALDTTHPEGTGPGDSRERWSLVAAAIQAGATLGMFIIALVGLWNVQPIITYQLERQAREERDIALAPPPQATLRAESPVAAAFVGEVSAWWRDQVRGYERILELIRLRNIRPLQVSFEIVEHPGLLPGTTEPDGGLLVTATHTDGEIERVRVPINDAAIPPTQFVQYRVNQGAFAALGLQQRRAVEAAVAAHTRRFMMPVPPPRVTSTMTLGALYSEIDSAQSHRLDAATDIGALAMVIDDALARDGGRQAP